MSAGYEAYAAMTDAERVEYLWDRLEASDHRGAVMSLRHQRDRLRKRVDALEVALRDCIHAFDECTGDHAKEIAADDMRRWVDVLVGEQAS